MAITCIACIRVGSSPTNKCSSRRLRKFPDHRNDDAISLLSISLLPIVSGSSRSSVFDRRPETTHFILRRQFSLWTLIVYRQIIFLVSSVYRTPGPRSTERSKTVWKLPQWGPVRRSRSSSPALSSLRAALQGTR